MRPEPKSVRNESDLASLVQGETVVIANVSDAETSPTLFVYAGADNGYLQFAAKLLTGGDGPIVILNTKKSAFSYLGNGLKLKDENRGFSCLHKDSDGEIDLVCYKKMNKLLTRAGM